MDSADRKEAIRKRLLAQRESLSEEAYLQHSAAIVNRLTALSEFKQSDTVHCYLSMNDRREVNTRELIRRLLASDKQLVVPETNMKDFSLTHRELNSLDDLQPNRWGVLEPEDGRRVEPEALDLVIVPMVGADPACNRMGYGKGFYDRFLAGVSGFTAGLCFEQCMLEQLPVEPFDIPLSAVVTEKRVLRRN